MSHFNNKAKNWDSGDSRVNGAKKIADAIEQKVVLTQDMEILDFGVGTGLLGFTIAKRVKQVYGVDTSGEMLSKLQEKNTKECNIIAYHQDIVAKPIEDTFDGIISSMTLHHVEDLDTFFQTIYKNICPGGFLAIADLEKEDGSFHSDNTGVFHFGFDTKSLCKIVQNCGFKNVSMENINTINKSNKSFGVFLLTATK